MSSISRKHLLGSFQLNPGVDCSDTAHRKQIMAELNKAAELGYRKLLKIDTFRILLEQGFRRKMDGQNVNLRFDKANITFSLKNKPATSVTINAAEMNDEARAAKKEIFADIRRIYNEQLANCPMHAAPLRGRPVVAHESDTSDDNESVVSKGEISEQDHRPVSSGIDAAADIGSESESDVEFSRKVKELHVNRQDLPRKAKEDSAEFFRRMIAELEAENARIDANGEDDQEWISKAGDNYQFNLQKIAEFQRALGIDGENEYQALIGQANQERDDALAMLEELRNSLKANNKDLEKAEAEIEINRAFIEDLGAKNVTNEAKIARFEAGLAEASRMAEILSETIAHQSEMINQLESMVNDAERAIEAYEQEIAALKAENAKLREELAAALRQKEVAEEATRVAQATLAIARRDADDSLEELEVVKRQSAEEIAQLKADLVAAEQKHAASAEQNQAKAEDIARLRQALEAAEQRHADSAEQNKANVEQIDGLQKALTSAEQRNAGSEEQNQAKAEEISRLQQDLAAAQERNADTAEQNQAKAEEIARLKQTLAEAQERNAESEEQNQANAEDIARLQQSLAAAQERNAASEEQNRANAQEIDALSEALASQENALGDMRSQLEQAVRQKEADDKANRVAQDQMQALLAENASLKDRQVHDGRTIDELSKRIAVLEKALHDLSGLLKLKQKEFEDLRAEQAKEAQAEPPIEFIAEPKDLAQKLNNLGAGVDQIRKALANVDKIRLSPKQLEAFDHIFTLTSVVMIEATPTNDIIVHLNPPLRIKAQSSRNTIVLDKVILRGQGPEAETYKTIAKAMEEVIQAKVSKMGIVRAGEKETLVREYLSSLLGQALYRNLMKIQVAATSIDGSKAMNLDIPNKLVRELIYFAQPHEGEDGVDQLIAFLNKFTSQHYSRILAAQWSLSRMSEREKQQMDLNGPEEGISEIAQAIKTMLQVANEKIERREPIASASGSAAASP